MITKEDFHKAVVNEHENRRTPRCRQDAGPLSGAEIAILRQQSAVTSGIANAHAGLANLHRDYTPSV